MNDARTIFETILITLICLGGPVFWALAAVTLRPRGQKRMRAPYDPGQRLWHVWLESAGEWIYQGIQKID
jgi:hypothetical protein